jgi:predicted enzyme related to lactoylglutathione lyase
MISSEDTSDHIIGIGGIFFKAKDPSALQEWYQNNLGFSPRIPFYEDDTAITFGWKTFDGENNNTVWAPFKEDTEYFSPSKKEWMLNYVVKDIEGLLAKLKKKGIERVGKLDTYEYGKFVRILDPEGNKIEFWEPDSEFFKDKY